MKLETFFKNFDFLADAPNGVQKLRELILQLAVRGKLVPQDKNDEPASVLLEQIRFEKELLIKEGKFKKDKSVPTFVGDEIPHRLPKVWEWVKLDSICHQITDGTHHTPTYISTGIPFLSVKDISGGKLDLSDTRYISKQEHEELIKRCKPEFEDILLTKVGTTGIAKVINVDIEFSIFVSLALLKFPKHLILPYYLELVINSPLVKEQSKKYTQGVGNKNLVLKSIKDFIVPIPPLAEQHRIVAKVDELMALCDRLSERQQKRRSTRIIINNAAIGQLLTAREPEVFNKSWQHICNNFDLLYSTPDNIGKLRQAILQLAVQGKLVPQDANDEPASVLLEKIKLEKERLVKEGKISKPKLLPSIEAEEISFRLPHTWNWSRINDITLLVTDGEHATPARINTPEVPLVTAKNVRDGYLDFTNTDFVSYATAEKCWQRCQPIHNDILMVCVGATTGRLCLIKQPGNFVMVRSVSLIRPFENYIYPEYMAVVIKSPMGQNQIWNKVKQSAQPCLYINKIQSICIPIPPLNEQKRIVAKVNQLMSLCDTLETKLTQSVTDSEKLMEAAVRQILAANSNKTDKHESVLLESIHI